MSEFVWASCILEQRIHDIKIVGAKSNEFGNGVNAFRDSIFNTAKQLCGMIKEGGIRKQTKWWSKEIRSLIRRKKNSERNI